MEKLAYGLSFLAVLYLVFLYLTAKTLLEDASGTALFTTKKKRPKKEK